MVETAFHGPVKVGLFLLLCSDFVIVSGRKAGFLFERDSGLCQVIRLAYGACPGDLFVSFFRIVSAFFPLSHKISSFFCSRPYYYAVSRKIFFRISFGFSRCCCMFLYKTFWNLYKTEYFLYKNRRKFRHVFSGFPWFLYSYSGFFFGRSPSFWVKESGFLIYLSVF